MADRVPTRLHRADTLLHDGDTGPGFAHRAAEDVLAAMVADEGLVPRELLVARHTCDVADAP